MHLYPFFLPISLWAPVLIIFLISFRHLLIFLSFFSSFPVYSSLCRLWTTFSLISQLLFFSSVNSLEPYLLPRILSSRVSEFSPSISIPFFPLARNPVNYFSHLISLLACYRCIAGHFPFFSLPLYSLTSLASHLRILP